LFLANAGSYAFGFWLPDTIKGASNMSASAANYWSMLPYLASLAIVLLSGHLSDRTGKRKLLTGTWMLLSGVFLALGTIPGQSFEMRMVWLCLTAASIYAWPSSFWVLPSLSMSAAAAAAAIGFINSFGNLGGFVGPKIMAKLTALGKEAGLADNISKNNGLLVLATMYGLAGVLVFCLQLRNNQASQSTSNPAEVATHES
jgi:ACS family tartrate transporter-like MFS transporter